ncbi:hypothetical protein B0H14DRAFT_2695278 [Mycena olivaceomarginata]|nr:hypothetical protein B0H14DRAFT_2695278 [Mycena olivaceomarginata]
MSSEAASSSKMLQLPLSKQDLSEINAHLRTLTPEEILAWAVESLPGLYQTTAFGLTGLVAIDMLSKITTLATATHLPRHALVEDVRQRYDVPIHIYKPQGCETVADFEQKFGQRLWETNEDVYDFSIKVEPARRAYQDLGVKAVITGRRQSQGADRATLQPLEVDETGLLKLNPLFEWTFPIVEWYISEYDVPRNKLLAQGYRSVGDWHSTVKVGEGQSERAGRWAGKEKTECGLHRNYFTMQEQVEKAAESPSLLSSSQVAICV